MASRSRPPPGLSRGRGFPLPPAPVSGLGTSTASQKPPRPPRPVKLTSEQHVPL